MIECIKSIIWICSWNIGVVRLQIRHRHSIRWASAPQCKFKYNYRIQTLAIICTRYSALIAYFIAFTLAFLRFGAQFYEAHSSRLNVRTCEMQCVIDAFDSSIIHRCDFCVFSSVHMWCDVMRCVYFPFCFCSCFLLLLLDFSDFLFRCVNFYFRFSISCCCNEHYSYESWVDFFHILPSEQLYWIYPTLTSRLKYFFSTIFNSYLLFNIICNLLSSKWAAFYAW